MHEARNVNYIDEAEYPSSTQIQNECVRQRLANVMRNGQLRVCKGLWEPGAASSARPSASRSITSCTRISGGSGLL